MNAAAMLLLMLIADPKCSSQHLGCGCLLLVIVVVALLLWKVVS